MVFEQDEKKYNLWSSLRKTYWFEMLDICTIEGYKDDFPIKKVVCEDGVIRDQKQYPVVFMDKFGRSIFNKWVKETFKIPDSKKHLFEIDNLPVIAEHEVVLSFV